MRRTPLILAILGVLLLGGVLAAGLIHRSPAKSESRPVLKVASQKGGSKALVLASGVLEGAPYDVEWSEFPSAAALLEALSSHAVDVGAVGDAPFMFAYASGAAIKVVQTSRASGGGTSTAVLVRKDSPLTSAAQLRGKRIATGRGSIGHYLLLRVLEREGLKPTDVKIVFLNPGDAKAAFSTGAVDAWVTWGAYVGLARLHDEARVLADGEGLLSGLNFQAASEKAIAEKSPQLTDFLRRLALAQQWAGDNQPAYAATLAKETGLPLDVAAYTVAQYRNLAVPIDDGVIAEERRTIDHFSRAGALTFNRDLAGAFDARFNAALETMTDVGVLDLSTDVLVIGGGLAGTWAAVAAAREGVRVILADKGYCGTSGVTATAGPGHWWVPPDPPELREAAIRDRQSRAFGLAESGWMAAIIDLTWRTLPTLAPYYDFGTDDRGQVQYRGLRGPEYMRAMRRLAQDQGVTILDHCPALELLVDRQGAVVGAAGTRRQARQPWTIRAGAVVLATGGCAFRSRLLGADTNTGDGLLMAAEAGADLSGMELSNYYTVAPARSNMTRSMAYSFGRYFDADGRELDIPQGAAPALARALLKGPVFCRLDRVPGDIRTVMPQVQPNFMLPFDRRGVDPYSQAFEVTLHGEGTVRGVGGLRVVDGDCRTAVRGLFVAGDAASRELIAGATSGGGAQNSAWALSSGHWAGQGAARLARGPGLRHSPIALHAGRAGMRPARAAKAVDPRAAIAAVRGEMEPYDKNMFRTGAGLARSLDAVETVWRELADHGRGEADQVLAHREAAAIAATARWCLSAALARNESRGMHQRLDAPDLDPALASRLRVGGLDRVWTAFERAPAARAIA